jgi:hypothetical protein
MVLHSSLSNLRDSNLPEKPWKCYATPEWTQCPKGWIPRRSGTRSISNQSVFSLHTTLTQVTSRPLRNRNIKKRRLNFLVLLSREVKKLGLWALFRIYYMCPHTTIYVSAYRASSYGTAGLWALYRSSRSNSLAQSSPLPLPLGIYNI